MSVIIKDMQMPEECEVCPMHHFYADTRKTVCILTHATLAKNYEFGIPFDRHEDCPLEEVEGGVKMKIELELYGEAAEQYMKDRLDETIRRLISGNDGACEWDIALEIRRVFGQSHIVKEGEK